MSIVEFGCQQIETTLIFVKLTVDSYILLVDRLSLDSTFVKLTC